MVLDTNTLNSSQQAECTNFIQCHPLFSNLPEEIIKQLSHQFSLVHAKKGEVIVKEDDPVDSIYYIANGEAEVTRQMMSPMQIPVAHLNRCDTIGLSVTGLYSPTLKRIATVTALSDMTLFRLDVNTLNEFVTKNEEYAQYFKEQSDRLTKIHFLKQIDLFEHLPSDLLFLIAKRMTNVTYQKNVILFREDEEGEECFLLQSGQVEITKENKQIALLDAPSIFGEGALVTGKKRTATAKTTTPCQMLVLSKEMLFEITAQDFFAADALSEVMLSRQTTLNTRPKKGFFLTKEGWLVFKKGH